MKLKSKMKKVRQYLIDCIVDIIIIVELKMKRRRERNERWNYTLHRNNSKTS